MSQGTSDIAASAPDALDAGRPGAAEAAALAEAEANPSPARWMDVALEAFSAYRFDAGHAAVARALTLDPDALMARWAAFQFPRAAAPATATDADAFVARWSAGLAEFEALDFDDPRWAAQVWSCIGQCTAFYLHYVTDAIAEQARYGALVHRMMAALSPSPALSAPRMRARRRIVFVSAYLREHTVARLFLPLFARLDPASFDVHGIALGGAPDALVHDLPPHVTLHRANVPADIWRDHLRRLAPDVIVYLDIGMHPVSQALAALRLAPVQAVLWGHPVTTGLPTIDWVLSPDAMEPTDGASHYTERLFRLPGLGHALRRSPPPAAVASTLRRAPGNIELLCPQSVYKLLPGHDALFARILARLPRARLHLIAHEQAHVREWLAARMAPTLAAHGVDPVGVVLHPMLPLPEYLALARDCDLGLDSVGWSGGMSSIDLLSQGLPIVTVAGRLMRSRQTAALLQRLGAPELVAINEEDYVERAVALANDTPRRDALAARLRENAPRLYQNDDAAAGLAEFLATVQATG
ncbi:hypothetical protein [Chiayiivirga flava]|uniref:Putative O-linked N-acetylglucosamine transferase (SPINDLY family) n=1 Tax=Chiayiivirga flava TaxID=659595 RepID=A0A7W8D699_9GAMM|nr:hypothetical protein [Chiayiivirga flava]MBB5208714.1 putative O-linked N-acetylglucosamine transferase (SPINDLY family) [Chiayiivirga flava]